MGILDKALDIRYVIGIDLGTTQCALSYCDLHDKNLKIKNNSYNSFFARAASW